MQIFKTVTTVFMALMILLFAGYGIHAKDDKKTAWTIAGVFTAILLCGVYCIWV